MSSQIDTSNININFPVQGKDNPSQGFRDNFGNIAAQLNVAATEITGLQNTISSLSTATTSTLGGVIIGDGLSIDGTGVISVPYILPTYTTSTLNTVIGLTAGSVVYVSDAPGGSAPCFYDGTHWYSMGRSQIL